MFKPLCLAALVLCASPLAHADNALTRAETKWIAAGMPVVRAARALGLPVDIVVQPGDQPDASPIAMGIKDGRCKLVLSMRGNPGAKDLDSSVPAGLFTAAAEAVFAHEIGHCWRYVQGVWNALPAGFVESADADAGDGASDDAELAAMRREIRESRREEGYADLVGLAWTQRTHPAQYAAIHDWLQQFRDDALPGQQHDTSAWLQVAADPSAFDAGADLFLQAQALWQRGLRAQPSKGGGPSVSIR